MKDGIGPIAMNPATLLAGGPALNPIEEIMRWRKREDHPEMFFDGEVMLVAIARPGRKRDIDCITILCDEENFDLMCNDQRWAWEWDDVEYWLPIDEVIATIPQEAEVSHG